MIIGISGKIGSGKDTLANFIIKNNTTYHKKAYAEKLKLITSILTGVALEDVYTQEGKNVYMPNWGMTVGEFQQKLGTEGMRKGVHEDGWVISLFSDYNFIYNWVITDVRFLNEAEAIKKHKGILIRIIGDPAKIRENSTRDLLHSSETSLDNYNEWDYIYNNKSTLEDLETFAIKVLSEIS